MPDTHQLRKEVKVEVKRMKTINNLLIIHLLILLGCNNSTSINDIADYQTLAIKIKEGDIESYKKMRIVCLDYHPSEIIKWAKYAADTLNYGPANLDAFEGYINSSNIYSDTVLLKKVNKSDRMDVIKYYEKAKLAKIKGSEKYIMLY
jgi:hypothetical protein